MLSPALLEGLIESTRLEEKEREEGFRSVATDTRKLEPGSLFVPLVGDRFNGHDFLLQAIEGGAAAALWQADYPLPEKLPDDFQLYFVKDTLAALQRMAGAYRQQVDPVVIGVTGSNGKTTTKDLLFAVLSLHKETYKTQGNYNNHIGLPLTILAMPATCEYLILEMGMSGFGEIALLSEIALPDVAIVTNIGDSHLEQLGSREGIAKAKMEITTGLKKGGTVIIDGDESLLNPYRKEATCTVGFSGQCDAILSAVNASEAGYSFQFADLGRFSLPLLGEHNVKNAGFVIAAARQIGVPQEAIRRGLESVSLTGMRLEKQRGKQGELIINDAYNASPTSMMAAIETVKALPGFEKRIAVLGDMYELGNEEEMLHRKVADVISEPLTHLICIGEKARWIAAEAIKSTTAGLVIHWARSKDEAAAYIRTLADARTAILFKASRGMKLEEVIDAYQTMERGNDEC
ncbi:UDP-N-acetylmuramoyl-tripeptide--D-alanyl-D-alanine ligase [Halalkalibacter oceani]|uniref:UDP-N-acetylmuramoyl-tripeptide--D-alanyl-D-alanine ligase n=1 Tax=Halalkalibacter oceani TaxID=1653776 RepID=A0A9X2DNA0_9BACI|nr:UDP-N-acetylmuramoyl-tripeptide--D-alanyl-D-alanine ligase [Halalkalibacter oceani]MCM3713100.1 UDP-N-acetylmuramoyl-tripeptide--D-alanyl-D-alanine ligase [Halalkalibacter oceani]